MQNPLKTMRLRAADNDNTLSWVRSPVGGSFGRVRSSGQRAHQGWDLLAPIGTETFAIGPGVVEGVRNFGDYGLQVLLRLDSPRYKDQTLYAFYAHLSVQRVATLDRVMEGAVIGMTGNSGNAQGTAPHLHFEIRTLAWPGRGLVGRIDPGEILGYDHYACSL